MGVFSVLLTVVLPVFSVVGLGALLGRRMPFDAGSINRLAAFAAVPALVFRSMSSIDFDARVLSLAVGYLTLLLVLAAVAALVGLSWTRAERNTLMGTTLSANAANINLPVALFAFGEAGLERALVIYVMTALLLFSVGPLLLGRGENGAALPWRHGLRAALTFPVLWASLAGWAVGASGIELPMALNRAVALLADAAVPIVLLSLGIHLSRNRRWWPQRRAQGAVVLKLMVAPLLAFAVARLLGLEGTDVAVLVLIGAMPTAINTTIVAIEFGGDLDFIGDTVVTGTLLSVVTIPIVLAFTKSYLGLF
jgi:predicted permease